MLAGIRTRDLHKIYNSAPPLASGGGFGFGSARRQGQEDLAAGSGFDSAFSAQLCLRYAARGAVLRLWRSGSWLQYQSNSHRLDVQHGPDPDDLFRVYVLSLERAGPFPNSPKNRADQSAGVHKRRAARNPRTPIHAPATAGCLDRVDYFRRGISGSRSSAIPPKAIS